MKISTLIKEYIWLMHTIYQAGKISFSEINRRWSETDMSGGVGIARTTFNRYKDAIEDIFGVIIECDKKDGFKYYIANKSVLREDTITNWMLSSMTVHAAVQGGISLQDRILLENVPSGYKYLQPILDAMKSNSCISITYKKYKDVGVNKYDMAEPYCLKLYEQRWYVLIKTGEKFRLLSLDRIRSLDIQAKTFNMDKDFDAKQYFHDCYGVYRDDKLMPQRVVLRAFKDEIPYLRDLPLHHSQEECNITTDYSDFAYYLYPSDDFIGEILRKKNRLYVVSPESLRNKVLNTIKEMEQNYIKQ